MQMYFLFIFYLNMRTSSFEVLHVFDVYWIASKNLEFKNEVFPLLLFCSFFHQPKIQFVINNVRGDPFFSMVLAERWYGGVKVSTRRNKVVETSQHCQAVTKKIKISFIIIKKTIQDFYFLPVYVFPFECKLRHLRIHLWSLQLLFSDKPMT